MSKYRIKTEEELKADNQWDDRSNRPKYWSSFMINSLSQPIDDCQNGEIEGEHLWFRHSDGYIYPTEHAIMENKEEVLPIGTEVYITDKSEHYTQGIRPDGKKMIGKITDHLSTKYSDLSYIYEVTWADRNTNTYQACDVEPVDKEKEINEEEINNELKQLFNQILNN